jgi:hypothetical protein
MRPRPETIRLGACEWPVRPLTLRQVQEIEPILMSSTAETKGNVAAALAIVAIALGRDHADAAALLGDIEATAPEIGAAMTTVLRLGGFIEKPAQGDAGLGEAQAGEVRAADPPASISTSSTQDS